MLRKTLAVLTVLALGGMSAATAQTALQQHNEVLFQQLKQVHKLSSAELDRLREIFARSGYIGQGNPAISTHPLTTEQCRSRIPGGVNGYANSWWIDLEQVCESSKVQNCVKNPDGSYDIEMVIEFWPQRWFYLGLIISGMTLFGCLWYLGYDWRKRRKIRKNKDIKKICQKK